ncbi:Antioxidant enzyme [Gryllus bimaculatus]|nr:Antioxidant enzyme [Gryllus bimaculatus]
MENERQGESREGREGGREGGRRRKRVGEQAEEHEYVGMTAYRSKEGRMQENEKAGKRQMEYWKEGRFKDCGASGTEFTSFFTATSLTSAKLTMWTSFKVGHGVEKVEISLEEQKVKVTSSLPAEDLLAVIKKTGKATEYLGVQQ